MNSDEPAEPTPPPTKPDDKKEQAGVEWDAVAKAAGGVTVFVTALGALAVTGNLARVQREHADVFRISIILVVAAGALWALDVVFRATGFRTKMLASLAVLALSTGLVLGLAVVVKTHSESPRPQIDAVIKTEGGPTLEASVKASGLHSEDHLRVLVEGIDWERGSQGRPRSQLIGQRFPLLYGSWIGPDGNGTVEHTIRLPLGTSVLGEAHDEVGILAWVVPKLPPKCKMRANLRAADCGEYIRPFCYDRPARRQTGCIRLRVPRAPAGPRITANWDQQKLVIKIGAEGVPTDSGIVNARVYARARRYGRELVASGQFRPNVQGVVEAEWRIPIAKRHRRVCVVAAIDRDVQRRERPILCPPKATYAAAWTRLWTIDR